MKDQEPVQQTQDSSPGLSDFEDMLSIFSIHLYYMLYRESSNITFNIIFGMCKRIDHVYKFRKENNEVIIHDPPIQLKIQNITNTLWVPFGSHTPAILSEVKNILHFVFTIFLVLKTLIHMSLNNILFSFAFFCVLYDYC